MTRKRKPARLIQTRAIPIDEGDDAGFLKHPGRRDAPPRGRRDVDPGPGPPPGPDEPPRPKGG
jgi:hypothetical protein